MCIRDSIGNYDRIVGELEALDVDALIVRIDLRNHGLSVLENGEMDKRDTSVLRFAGDVADVIQSIVEEFEIENIHLHGTCMGGLVSQCVAVGLTTSNSKEYMDKIRSLFLNCPLAFEILGTTDPNDGFNYKKNKMILDGPSGTQFTKTVSYTHLDFGCFVELWPGCEGLVHVSQLAHERVKKPSDVVKVGDEILVKSQGYDNKGRLNLSRKDALPKPPKKEEKKHE